MQVSVESGAGLERRMTVQLPGEKVDQEIERRLKKLAGTVRMDGFRPGKVPLRVVRQRFGGQVRQEVYGDLIRDSYATAVQQESLRPAGDPRIESLDDEAGDGLSYTAVFEVMPDIRVQDLKALSVKRPAVEVTDADVDKMLENLRRQRKAWEPVDRPAAEGDQLTISFKGYLEGDEFEGGSAEKVPLELGAGNMVPGFEQGLEGASAGEGRSLEVRFPDDYRAEHLAGKDVRFDVEVHEVKEGRLPPVDEEFAKAFGVADGDVDALRRDVRANMERELKQTLRSVIKNRVMDALLEHIPLEVPGALVDREAAHLKEQARAEMAGAGQRSAVDLPSEMFADQARRRVALGLIIAEIVRRNDIRVEADRVKAAVEEIADSYEDPQQVISWYYGNKEQLAAVENLALEDQVVEWVLAQGRVEDEPVSFDELMGQNA
jgi:trigger factor